MNRLFLLLSTLVALSARAEPAVWQLDHAHTQVFFTVSHLGFTEMLGQFRKFDATLKLDPEDWTRSSVEAVIEAASVDMNHEGLNEHLRNEDFFHVEKHPTLRFRSTRVENLGGDRLRLHGELTLLGQTRPVSLEVRINKFGEHPMRKVSWVGFRAEGRIKRSDFGMTYALGPVGDEVGIILNVEAGLPPPAP